MRNELRTHRELAELASRQYGVVTWKQLSGLGYSKAAVSRAVSAGRLHPLQRSVFAVGHRGVTSHGLCLSAVLFRGEGALLSYQSAAWLWVSTASFSFRSTSASPGAGTVRTR